jgi:hypothetical protein
LLEGCALITAIGVELQVKGIEAEQRRHHQDAAVAILNVGGVNDGVHQKTLRINEDVPLLAFDLFARVKATQVNAGPPFSALFTLWPSMMAAVAEASRPTRSRHST